jgi:hypothetical protein
MSELHIKWHWLTGFLSVGHLGEVRHDKPSKGNTVVVAASHYSKLNKKSSSDFVEKKIA